MYLNRIFVVSKVFAQNVTPLPRENQFTLPSKLPLQPPQALPVQQRCNFLRTAIYIICTALQHNYIIVNTDVACEFECGESGFHTEELTKSVQTNITKDHVFLYVVPRIFCSLLSRPTNAQHIYIYIYIYIYEENYIYRNYSYML